MKKTKKSINLNPYYLWIIMVVTILATTCLKAQDTLPNPRTQFGSVYYNGSWYIFGGLVDTTQSKFVKSDDVPDNDLHEFTNNNMWNDADADNPPQERYNIDIIEINGDFYTCNGESYDLNNFLRDIWKYNPNSETWTDLTQSAMGDIPNNVAGYGLTVFENLMYLYGGHVRFLSGTYQVDQISSDIYSYNPETNYWEWINAGPSPKRHDFASVEHLGKIYVVGGKDENGDPTNSLWVFDHSTNTWCEIAPASGENPGVFYGGEATKVKILDQWWIMIFGGGTNTTLLNEVWGYNIAENLWKVFDAFPPIPFFNPAAFFLESANKMNSDTAIVTVFGGRDSLMNVSNQFKRYVFDTTFCNVYDYDILNHQWVPEGTVGLIQAQIIPKVKLYPNPTTNFINMEFESKQSQTFTISLFNIKGQLIETKEEKGTKIKTQFNMQKYPSGTYVLSIEGDSGLLYRGALLRVER